MLSKPRQLHWSHYVYGTILMTILLSYYLSLVGLLTLVSEHDALVNVIVMESVPSEGRWRKREDRDQQGFKPHHKITVRETTKYEVCITGTLYWCGHLMVPSHTTRQRAWWSNGLVTTVSSYANHLKRGTQLYFVYKCMGHCLTVLKNTWRTQLFSKGDVSVSNISLYYMMCYVCSLRCHVKLF